MADDRMNVPDDAFIREHKRPYTDLAAVESQRNDLTAEEFPEGAYGAVLPVESLGKSTPWREDQRPPNRFTYENRALHTGLDRGYPGDHPIHDDDPIHNNGDAEPDE